MNKLIFTIDLDAFFASCEELRHQELKNEPIVIARELNGRGIAVTANYPARSLGVKTGMPLFQIREFAPKIKVINPDYEFYQKKANEVFKTIMTFSEIIEIASIDECYLDVTKLTDKYKPIQLAKIIQTTVKEKTGLAVSIGISTNIVLSKMASDMDKPKGITTLFKHEIPTKLWPLKVGKLYFVGRKTADKLVSHNINTIGELANIKSNAEKYNLIKKELGINFDKHIEIANGIYTDVIKNSDQILKSISKEETFGVSLTHIDAIIEGLKPLFEFALNRINARKVFPTTIYIFLKKDKNFKHKSKSRKLSKLTNDKDFLWGNAIALLEDVFQQGDSIKQIGIGFSGLTNKQRVYKQLSIDETLEPNIKSNTIDEIALDANSILKTNLVTGSEMKDNRNFKKKEPVDRDTVTFKIWEN